MTKYLEIHALQTLPPSNINRDGEGRPKTAIYGGTKRMRVSSQAWKRTIRETFRNAIDSNQLGLRSRELTTMIADRLPEPPEDKDQLLKVTSILMGKAGLSVKEDKDRPGCTSALQFFGEQQWQMLANIVDEALKSDDPESVIKSHKSEMRKKLDSDKAIDVALFGRMSASEEKGESSAYVVDAACQMAHAISVDKAEDQYDYYSAVDDCDDVDGFGFSDTAGFMSSTLYRYTAVNLDLLNRNLAGDKDAEALALKTFVTAFITSMPSGKRNSFAPQTLPALVVAMIRDDRPVNLVEAYEQPVEGDTVTEATQRLFDQYADYQSAYELHPATIRITATSKAKHAIPEEFAGSITPLGALISNTVAEAVAE